LVWQSFIRLHVGSAIYPPENHFVVKAEFRAAENLPSQRPAFLLHHVFGLAYRSMSLGGKISNQDQYDYRKAN
jgi:hypothetical protein